MAERGSGECKYADKTICTKRIQYKHDIYTVFGIYTEQINRRPREKLMFKSPIFVFNKKIQ